MEHELSMQTRKWPWNPRYYQYAIFDNGELVFESNIFRSDRKAKLAGVAELRKREAYFASLPHPR